MEFAVVLTLLGVISTGIYISYDFFIKRTKTTKTMIEMKDYRKGFESFHSVYGAFPGDITSASRRIDDSMIDGNGDGKIATEMEQNAFWPHMSYSKIIAKPTGGKYENVATNVSPKIDVNLPRLQDSDDIAIGVVYNTPSGMRANSYVLGGIDGRAVTLPRFSVDEVQIMDQKFDDGNPITGGVMCGKGLQSATLTACNYLQATTQSDAGVFIPFTTQTTDSTNSCPAQSVQISQQLVVNAPAIPMNATQTYNCRDINPNYSGTYSLTCTQLQNSANVVIGYSIAVGGASCSLKVCPAPLRSSISNAASVESVSVQAGQPLSYTCNSGYYNSKSLCSPNLTTDAAVLSPAPTCTTTPIGTSGNIPIYGADSLQDSGRKFNDAGTTLYDIISASKVYNLFGSTTNSQNYLSKYGTQNSGVAQSLVYDNGTSVGIGTASPNANAVLELNSTNKGLLLPRMTTVQMNAVSPVAGMVIYNTDIKAMYQHNGTDWIQIGAGGGSSITIPATPVNAVLKTDGSALKATSITDNATSVNIGTNVGIGSGATAPAVSLAINDNNTGLSATAGASNNLQFYTNNASSQKIQAMSVSTAGVGIGSGAYAPMVDLAIKDNYTGISTTAAAATTSSILNFGVKTNSSTLAKIQAMSVSAVGVGIGSGATAPAVSLAINDNNTGLSATAGASNNLYFYTNNASSAKTNVMSLSTKGLLVTPTSGVGTMALQLGNSSTGIGNLNTTGINGLSDKLQFYANSTTTPVVAINANGQMGIGSGANAPNLTLAINDNYTGISTTAAAASTSSILNFGVKTNSSASATTNVISLSTKGLQLLDATAAETVLAADKGTIYYDTTVNALKLYNGTAWQTMQTVPIGGSSFWLSSIDKSNNPTSTISYGSDISVNGMLVGRGGNGISSNMAIGNSALQYNIIGAYNAAIGNGALQYNTTGSGNAAIGYNALQYNTTGAYNAALGNSALMYNTTGSGNAAIGYNALYGNTTGNNNAAIGYGALQYNTTGSDNAAIGEGALYSNTTGTYNTAIGMYALNSNTTGDNNTAIGNGAGNNLAGVLSNTAGSNNVFLGANSIGESETQSNTITMGNGNIAKFRIPALGFSILKESDTKAWMTVPKGETISALTYTDITIGAIEKGYAEGTIYYDTTVNALKLYNGTAWQTMATGIIPQKLNAVLISDNAGGVTTGALYDNGTNVGIGSGAADPQISLAINDDYTGISTTAADTTTSSILNFGVKANSSTLATTNVMSVSTAGMLVTPIAGIALHIGEYATGIGSANYTSTAGLTTALNFFVNDASTPRMTLNANGQMGIGSGAADPQISLAINDNYTGISATIGASNVLQFYTNNTSTDTTNVMSLSTKGLQLLNATAAETVLEADKGTIYYDTTVNALKLYNGTAWQTMQTVPIGGSSFWLASTDTSNNPTSTISYGSDISVNGMLVGRGKNGIASNMAIGVSALQSNTTGDNNTAIGNRALQYNTTGAYNAALGTGALRANTTGGSNAAIGTSALYSNTTGSDNAAMGHGALSSNTTGSDNTAIGYGALIYNTTGSGNTAIGYGAGSDLAGVLSTTTGSNNVFLGANSTGESKTQKNTITLDSTTDSTLDTIQKFRIPALGFSILKDSNAITAMTVPTGGTIGALTYTDPTTGVALKGYAEGTIYYDTTAKALKLYNGTAWQTMTIGTIPTIPATPNAVLKTDGSALKATSITDDGTSVNIGTNVGIGPGANEPAVRLAINDNYTGISATAAAATTSSILNFGVKANSSTLATTNVMSVSAAGMLLTPVKASSTINLQIGDYTTGIGNGNYTTISGLTNTLDFFVNDTSIPKMTLNANGELTVGTLKPSSLTVTGTTSLAGLTATSISSSGTLTVTGDSTLTGLLKANGGLTVTGTTSLAGLTVGTAAVVGTAVGITPVLQAADPTGNLTVYGTTSLAGLTVTGTSNNPFAVTATGVVTTAGLTATGAVAANAGLTVTGTSGNPFTVTAAGVVTTAGLTASALAISGTSTFTGLLTASAGVKFLTKTLTETASGYLTYGGGKIFTSNDVVECTISSLTGAVGAVALGSGYAAGCVTASSGTVPSTTLLNLTSIPVIAAGGGNANSWTTWSYWFLATFNIDGAKLSNFDATKSTFSVMLDGSPSANYSCSANPSSSTVFMVMCVNNVSGTYYTIGTVPLNHKLRVVITPYK